MKGCGLTTGLKGKTAIVQVRGMACVCVWGGEAARRDASVGVCVLAWTPMGRASPSAHAAGLRQRRLLRGEVLPGVGRHEGRGHLRVGRRGAQPRGHRHRGAERVPVRAAARARALLRRALSHPARSLRCALRNEKKTITGFPGAKTYKNAAEVLEMKYARCAAAAWGGWMPRRMSARAAQVRHPCSVRARADDQPREREAH